MPAETGPASLPQKPHLGSRLTRSALAEPGHQPLAVIPSWVERQLRDLVGLLSETPERTKAEFQRLGVAATLEPIYREGERPFFRATVEAALPSLAGTRDLSRSVVDRSLPQAAGSRTWGFRLDLPANLPGPGSRQRVG